MCGLVGCIRDDALYKSIEGLKKLEYRGYDSCGIAFYNKSLHIYKSLKGVFDLSKKVYKKQASIAIAHTRWATHGNVSLKNAHPHKGDRIILVHNGIISNYQELKQKYSLSTKSDTDTEVALKLIEYFYKNDLLDAINKAVELFNGSYSMIIIDINDLSKLGITNVFNSSKADLSNLSLSNAVWSAILLTMLAPVKSILLPSKEVCSALAILFS